MALWRVRARRAAPASLLVSLRVGVEVRVRVMVRV